MYPLFGFSRIKKRNLSPREASKSFFYTDANLLRCMFRLPDLYRSRQWSMLFCWEAFSHYRVKKLKEKGINKKFTNSLGLTCGIEV